MTLARVTRTSVTTSLALVLLVLIAQTSQGLEVDTDAGGDNNSGGNAHIALTADESELIRSSSESGLADGDAHPTKYQRMDAAFCRGTESPMRAKWIGGACEHNMNAMQTVTCEPGELRLDALWSSVWNEGAGVYNDWVQQNWGSCLTTRDLTEEARHAFELLTIPAPTVSMQPPTWSLVNLHSPAAADSTPHTFEVVLLDIPVVLEAVATRYTWDFGDGTPPLVTDDPGRPWQDGDPLPDESWVGHTWTSRGTFPVSVTTTWTGRFAITGTDAWQDIDAEVTTTSSAGTIEVVEARSQLVTDTLG